MMIATTCRQPTMRIQRPNGILAALICLSAPAVGVEVSTVIAAALPRRLAGSAPSGHRRGDIDSLAALVHRPISSSLRVSRKPYAETDPTMMKMIIAMAEARPICWLAGVNATRSV